MAVIPGQAGMTDKDSPFYLKCRLKIILTGLLCIVTQFTLSSRPQNNDGARKLTEGAKTVSLQHRFPEFLDTHPLDKAWHPLP